MCPITKHPPTCFANKGLPSLWVGRMHARSQCTRSVLAWGACISIKQCRWVQAKFDRGRDTPHTLSCLNPCPLPSPQKARAKPGRYVLAVLDPTICGSSHSCPHPSFSSPPLFTIHAAEGGFPSVCVLVYCISLFIFLSLHCTIIAHWLQSRVFIASFVPEKGSIASA